MYHGLLQSVRAAEAVYRQGLHWVVCHCFPAVVRQEFVIVQCASDSSPTLHEGYRRIFKAHELMQAHGTPSLTSIRGTAHTLMNLPAGEI